MHSSGKISKSVWIGTNILMVAAMVIIGGITRITNSGLSMTEWSLITGIIPPLNLEDWNSLFNKYKQTPEFEFKNYDMALSEFKFIFFWEYFHRIWGRLMGLTFFLPLVYFWLNKKLSQGEKQFFMIMSLLGIFQAFMGWFMVKSGLADKPDVSHFRLSAHLTTAFLIYIMLVYSFWNYLNRDTTFKISAKTSQIKKHRRRIILCIVLLIITISSGAFVSGTNAGWVYNNFPLMGDSFFPPIILDGDKPNLLYFLNDIGFIQFMHRILASLTLFFIIYTVYKAVNDLNLKPLKPLFYFLGFFVICQYSLGVVILKLYVPYALGLFHQIGALVVITNLIIILAETKNKGAKIRPSV